MAPRAASSLPPPAAVPASSASAVCEPVLDFPEACRCEPSLLDGPLGRLLKDDRWYSAFKDGLHRTLTLKRQIDDLHKLVAVAHAFAPYGFEIGERLLGDDLQGGFSLRLQFLDAIARSDEHVAGFREVRFVAERAVPRNNLGVIVGERENFVGGGNHAGDCSARTGVDVGITAVE